MTVSNTNNRMDYLGDGAHDTYDYTFRIFEDDNLAVYARTAAGVETSLALTTDFNVDGAGDEDGGDIVLVAGDLTAGDTLTLLRVLPLTQPTSLRAYGPVFAAIEDALDRACMIDQQLQEQIDRCFAQSVTVSSSDVSPVLPIPSALELLRWNAAADALENVDPSTLFEDVVMTGDRVVDHFDDGIDYTAGVSTSVTLSQAPGSLNNCDVYFGAARQNTDTLSLAGAVLTFLDGIPDDVLTIEVMQAHALPMNVLGSATVDTASIVDGAVTSAKIAALAIDSTKLALGAVGLPQVAAGLLQSGRNFLVDGSMMLAGGADKAFTAGDAYAYGKADHWKGQLTVSGSGTLSRNTASAFGRTGRSLKWTVTAAGASVITMRTFIEGIDAAGMANKTVTLSGVMGHDAGANRNFTLNVYKADAIDDFSAVTSIRAGTPTAIPTGVGTLLAERAIAMGDCRNGVVVEVVIASGIVTAKNFEFTEMQLELGTQETEFEFQRFADVEARGSWYFERIPGDPYGGGITPDVAQGFCTDTTHAYMLLHYRPKRALTTVTTFVRNGFYVIDYSGTTVQTTGGTGSASSANQGRTCCFLIVTVAAGLTAGKAAFLRVVGLSSSYFTVDARF